MWAASGSSTSSPRQVIIAHFEWSKFQNFPSGGDCSGPFALSAWSGAEGHFSVKNEARDYFEFGPLRQQLYLEIIYIIHIEYATPFIFNAAFSCRHPSAFLPLSEGRLHHLKRFVFSLESRTWLLKD